MLEQLTLSFQPVEEGWVQVRVEEYPEVVTVARNRHEARLMALDALREYLASFEPGEPIPTREGLKESLR